MELDAEEASGLGDSDDTLGERGCSGRLRRVRVREVERLPVGLHRRPADARDAARAEPDRSTGKEPEPGDTAVLLRLVERELQAQADAEREATITHPSAQRLVESPIAQPVHRA